MADADRYYPKQPLEKAIERGIARPLDSAARQRVRMGDNPERRMKEDFSIRVAEKSGRTYTGGQTIGEAADEERAASRRPGRRHSRGRRR